MNNSLYQQLVYNHSFLCFCTHCIQELTKDETDAAQDDDLDVFTPEKTTTHLGLAKPTPHADGTKKEDAVCNDAEWENSNACGGQNGEDRTSESLNKLGVSDDDDSSTSHLLTAYSKDANSSTDLSTNNDDKIIM